MKANAIISVSFMLSLSKHLRRFGEKPLDKLGVTVLVVVSLVLCRATFAASVSSPSTIDGGGKRTTSANYTMDASVGGIGGISSASADTAKNGYIGQLYEVTSLVVTVVPSSVSELSNAQLSASATLDDTTVLALAGTDVAWSTPGEPYPLSAISANGLVTPTNVYADVTATVNGYYLGTTGSNSLLVLDTNPDDYGTYAGDGIPDTWQVQYFGFNNAHAAPGADADGTGQNNLFKFVAGLDPTNPTSIFVLKIAAVNGQPNQKNLIYNPIATGRTYTVQYRTNLLSGVYTNLTGFSGPVTNINQATVTDLGATTPTKFYRIAISLP
jgi:hypothetical protein